MIKELTRARRFIQQGARRLGVQISRAPAPGTLAHHLRHVFRSLDITCAVDVGANDGQYARLLRNEVAFSGRIASVEPSTRAFSRLVAAMDRDVCWEGFNFALGDEDGVVTLNVLESDDFTSLHHVNSYGRSRFTRLDVIAREAVTVRRLNDAFVELTAGHEGVFVKADTQGHDLAVVRGLEERRVAALQIELSVRGIYEGIPNYLDVIAELEALGYRPSAFFPVSRAADGLGLVEMDGVFVLASLSA